MRYSVRALFAAALVSLVSAVACAQGVAGRDYTVLNPAHPTDSGKKIEVLEFFWYGCIHCYNLEGPLKAWLKRKPADVEFRYVPAVFDPSWSPLTRAFYTLDAMGVADKHHEDLFAAIHKEKQRALVGDPKAIAEWLGARGVDKTKFLETYNSFAVNTRAQRSIDLTRSYDIEGTPSIVVDGKYVTSPSRTMGTDSNVNYQRFFQVVDQLIVQARRDRGGK
jgi:thiol:disulfide interchange protein DsbA